MLKKLDSDFTKSSTCKSPIQGTIYNYGDSPPSFSSPEQFTSSQLLFFGNIVAGWDPGHHFGGGGTPHNFFN